jgi:hypothetical protein
MACVREDAAHPFIRGKKMSQQDEARNALRDAGLNLDEDTIARLARGEEVELSATSAVSSAADAADCCGDGWIGFGHKPRFCIKIANPPKFKICWG